MKFLFRADGNASVGAGHVMRCLSIADAARDKGIDCAFITAGDEFSEIIEGRGYRDIVLGTDYKDMDSELPQMARIVEDEHPAAVFVDSYFVTAGYLKGLRRLVNLKGFSSGAISNGAFADVDHEVSADHSAGGKLIYIDDVLTFPYPCDILLNYNIYADEGEYRDLYRDIALPELLLGTTYAPLRREFAEGKCRNVDKGYEDTCTDRKRMGQKSDGCNPDKYRRGILVSTGGADFEHLMIELIREVKERNMEYIFHFVVGAANEDRDAIFAEASGKDSIVLHENVTDMAELMLSCDVAISAAGSTLYELCACRVPTITYILADNQIPGACGFEQRGIMKCAGDIRELGAVALATRLIDTALQMCDNKEDRMLISKRQGNVVDVKGAERVVERILRC